MNNIKSQAAIYNSEGLWQQPFTVIKAFRGAHPHEECWMEIEMSNCNHCSLSCWPHGCDRYYQALSVLRLMIEDLSKYTGQGRITYTFNHCQLFKYSE
jgi:hypothetical protein